MDPVKDDTLLIYAPQVSPRLSYIAETLFGKTVSFTGSKEDLHSFQGSKINYSAEAFTTDSLHIVPHGLLAETGIRGQTVHCVIWQEHKIFFETAGDIPFDILAASFYLLSRYEEYLPHEKDQYGRYSPVNSAAYKHAFLNAPLVDQWMQLLEQAMQPKWQRPSRQPQKKFRFIPTYDIDEAYRYLHHPIWKNVLGFYKDLLQGKFETVIERGNVYSGRKYDPYDVFGWMDGLHEEFGLEPLYFLLTVIRPGKYDKNLPAASKAIHLLYRRLSSKYSIGIHPSWQSGDEQSLLAQELETLAGIIDRPVYLSRNHYLRFTVPDTYRKLIGAGITDDYSMAYGSVNGFRASYARPFKWYDLGEERATTLTVHPFCFMEATSFFSQGFTSAQAGEELQYYHDTVKKVRGEFITLFHNHFLTEQKEWVEWREMYVEFLRRNRSSDSADDTDQDGLLAQGQNPP